MKAELEAIIHDNGPIYYETGLWDGTYFIEPWNAISSIFFFAPVLYWLYQLKGNYRKHWIVLFCLPFLLMNGLGSTLFHGFRSSNSYLILDFLPMIILVFFLAIFLWKNVLKHWGGAILICLGISGVRFLLPNFASGHLIINLNYAISGLLIFTPIVILLIKDHFNKWHLITAAIGFLSLALFFRMADEWRPALLPMGVHWLWHLSSALAVFPLGHYLIHLNRNENNFDRNLAV